MALSATTQTLDSNVDANFRPYQRMGYSYPSEGLIKNILSGNPPKAYRNFSDERMHSLKVQAALSQQGYGHLLVGNKKETKNPYGLDGLFYKNSNGARQAWLKNNPEWIDKPFKEIDQEILRRSHNSLGISSPQFPEAGHEQDKFFLVQGSKIPSVEIKHDNGSVSTLSYLGIYQEIYADFKSEVKESRRLYEKGVREGSEFYIKKSAKVYEDAARSFFEIAVPLGRGLESDALTQQWNDKMLKTIETWNQWRLRPLQA